MFGLIAKLKVPYIMMHMKGNPKTMQQQTTYENLVIDIRKYFSERVARARALDIHDIIIDPGFGFSKNREQNFELLQQLDLFQTFDLPILAGLSRKSMIYKTLGVNADSALNGTTALNMLALDKGAKILRVHDVKEAMECIKLHEELRSKTEMTPFFLILQKHHGLDFLNFIDFKITDIIDIILVAILLYYVYKLVRGSVAINIFIGIVIIWGFWKLTELLGMEMISSLVGAFMQVGLIALIIVFQQEIRKFLLMIGSTNFSNKRNFSKHFKFLRQEGLGGSLNIEGLLKATERMSESMTGALLIFERTNSLEFVKTSGDKMNIEVTQPIIESIFYKNSPLHDGAAIVSDQYI